MSKEMKNPTPHKGVIGLVLSSVPGYSETFFRSKIKGLQEQGFEVILFVDYLSPAVAEFPCKIVFAPDFTGSSIKQFGISIKSLVRGFFLHPQRSFRLYRLDRRDGISFKNRLRSLLLNQFLLTESLDWLHFGFGMLSVGRENVAEAVQAKMAVSFRGYDLYLSPLKHPNCYRLLFQKEVFYHVLSQGMKATLLEYGVSSDHISIIPPAIDTDFFKSKDRATQWGTKPLQLITIARLHWKKGLEGTLEALSILKQQGIDFEYTIIGDGDERERLIFAAHQLGIMEQVHFVGKQSPVEVRRLLSDSDMYLQYSIQEGFCNAVLEAQSMGLLCLVSNAEGLDENVLDSITGWVVPKRQPQLLAQKIIEIIKVSKEEQETIRYTAIKRVQQDFDLQTQHMKFKDFYSSKD